MDITTNKQDGLDADFAAVVHYRLTIVPVQLVLTQETNQTRPCERTVAKKKKLVVTNGQVQHMSKLLLNQRGKPR